MTKLLIVMLALLLGVAAVASAGCSDGKKKAEPGTDVTVAPSEIDFSHPLVVYEANTGDADVSDIYILDPATKERARLTDGKAFYAGPAWSPDRRRIIFASSRDGQKETDIYTMARDGTDIQRLTSSPDAAEYEPRYAPDGSSIAFVRQDGKQWILSMMDPDGSNPRDLTAPQKFIEFPAWRPDGRLIAFAGIRPGGTSSDLFSVPPEGGDLTVVVSTDTADVCPHFTVDGEMMLYATTGEGAEQLDIFAHDIGNTDTSSKSDRRLTTDRAKDDYGEPGPDDRVVFVSNRDGNPELYIMNIDGSGQTRLTNTPGISENLPDW